MIKRIKIYATVEFDSDIQLKENEELDINDINISYLNFTVLDSKNIQTTFQAQRISFNIDKIEEIGRT